MLISPAFATDATTQAPGGFAGFIVSFGPIIILFVLFYFLLIRPQKRRMQEHNDMIGALKKGDRVMTGGGLIGTIHKVDETEVVVELAEGVRVTALKSTVQMKMAAPEKKADNAKGKKEAA